MGSHFHDFEHCNHTWQSVDMTWVEDGLADRLEDGQDVSDGSRRGLKWNKMNLSSFWKLVGLFIDHVGIRNILIKQEMKRMRPS